MKTSTPAEWRRLFTTHAEQIASVRLSYSPGQRGSFTAPEPDVPVSRIEQTAGPTLLRTPQWGALVPAELADAVWDAAVSMAQSENDARGVSYGRVRVELLDDASEVVGSTSNRRIELADEVELLDDGDPGEQQKHLHAMSMIRHATQSSAKAFELNMRQAKALTELSERVTEHVQATAQMMMAMSDEAIRRADANAAGMDPEVAREGLSVLRDFLGMMAANKAAAPPAPPPGEARPDGARFTRPDPQPVPPSAEPTQPAEPVELAPGLVELRDAIEQLDQAGQLDRLAAAAPPVAALLRSWRYAAPEAVPHDWKDTLRSTAEPYAERIAADRRLFFALAKHRSVFA